MAPVEATRAEFEWVGGRTSLDFTNTVSWHPDSLRRERLERYEHVLDWGVGAGVLTADRARELAAAAELSPEGASRALERALLVRELLHRLFVAVADGKEPEPGLVHSFNGLLARSLGHLCLTDAADSLAWQTSRDDLDAVLHPVIWSAAQILSSGDRALLRRCANDVCGWVFVDESRNKRRRWCDMRDCGNRAKARRHYARRRNVSSKA
jgi:predicted RNA-binding Zn ribbon-like protein